MMKELTFTAVVQKEGKRFSSLCPELDVASCGDSIAESLSELRKAIRLYFKVSKKPLRVSKDPVLITQVKLAS